ncbi:MAG: hypothetical protein OXG79_09330 [Chloroflexi bacterium]|nr:hypothetical protein [Chloroflexota bacterium]
MSRKDITVSVDEATYWRARICAAELDTSVSALVRDYLRTLAVRQAGEARVETAAERRGWLLDEVVADFGARGVGLDTRDSLPREDLYDRARARAEVAEAAPRP